MGKNWTKFAFLVAGIISIMLLSCESEIEEPEINPKNLLFVETSHKMDTSRVDIWFSPPATLDASSYTLQTSADKNTWTDFLSYGNPLTTTDPDTSDNFSTNLGSSCHIRLRITGGPYDGQFSNTMYAVNATVAVYFSYSSLDESLANTGIMAPNTGYGLVFTATTTRYSDNTVIDDSITYQWYRLDPENYDTMVAISGATTNTYTTTPADKGYRIMIEATGKNGVFDGMKRMLSQNIVR